jgi:hypothetical protein
MGDEFERLEGQSCPKRLWVMLSLSDDEFIGEKDSLPPGLQFHLSRCESCRALAERMQAVSGTLQEAARLEPDDALLDAATSRAVAALRRGAELTGRVEIPDEPEMPGTTRAAASWGRIGRYAAAAAILLAVGLFALTSLTGERGETHVETTNAGGPDMPGLARVEEQEDETPAVGELAGGMPEAVQPAGDDLPARMAEAAPKDTARPGLRRIVRHHSHIEAALSNDPHGAQAAIVLPDTTQRNLGWGKVFDRTRPTRSTKASREEQ